MKNDNAVNDLAIIGIGCLFPKAEGPANYWSNIKGRVDGIGDVPASHWDPKDYFDNDPKSPDRTYGRRGGFLDPVDFDPTEFGITPNNIPATDPAQLLGLVTAQAAMRDAGYGSEKNFDRRKVSVILGVTGTLELAIPLGARLGHPIWRRALKDAGIAGEQAENVIRRISENYVEWQENSFPGLLGNVVAGRIANRLDLGGTNCVVDAACASSLSAAHLAALELQTGRADMAVTGGVDAFNDIFMFMCFSKTPALSPTGDSRPFDAKGDGTILGEGIGMVVLKRLADAERDGDRVYAVLKGIGSSSDGRGKAIYAPSPEGQVKALKAAYALSGVAPSTIQLVEAHGTGTKVGDAAELKALTEVYGAENASGTWCALGSVKSNFGHTKAAAGAAGLIKAALALKHKVLPPTIKITEPLAGLNDGTTPFYLNTEKRPWMPPTGHPRRAAVSAFGFGGSNFHAVLEEHRSEKAEIDWDRTVELVAFSAADYDSLLAQLDAFAPASNWTGLRAQAAATRKDFDRNRPMRLVVAIERAADTAKLFAGLRETARKNRGQASWSTRDGAYFGSGAPAGTLAALFPGQGAQYVGMGRDAACQFPDAHRTLAEADRVLGLPLSDLLYPRPVFSADAAAAAESALRATDAAQPAIGAVSLGLLRVLARFGVAPKAAAGHSYGELTALCAAGRIGSEDLHRLSRLRGSLMAAGGGDKGTMLAALAPIAAVLAVVEREKLDVVLANKNAPEQVVLSGSKAAIAQAKAALDAREIRNTPLPVAAAFHSRLVADAAVPLRQGLEAVRINAGTLPVYANTTGEPYPADETAAKDLLARQLAQPVEFVSMIEAMHRDGARVFLEIGPGARLTGLVKAILGSREHVALAVDASNGRKSGILDLARALAQLSSLGLPVDLTPWEDGERTLKDAAETRKPKVVVTVSGATPSNAKGKQPMPELPKPAVPVIPSPAAPAPQPSMSVDALRVSQDGITALQRLQEQASALHKQYLEGQESAQKAVLGLIEQQSRLMLGPIALTPTLSHFVGEGAPAPAPLPPAPVAPAPEPKVAKSEGRVLQLLLTVVSDKTGYPAETLNLDMGLESDLGIDSIKRVEILAALREKLPDAPVVGPQHIGTLRSLRQIVDFLSAGQAAAAPARDDGKVQAVLLAVVSEKTGYPAETLNLDMGLESDLGIDSIKRVEILAAMRERLPEAPAVGPQHIGTLRTLRQIIDFLTTGAPAAPAAAAAPVSRPMAPAVSTPKGVSRTVLVSEPFTGAREEAPLAPGAKVWVAGDGGEFARRVAGALSRRGLLAQTLVLGDAPVVPQDLAALILVDAESRLESNGLWSEGSERRLKAAFRLARAAAPAVRRSRGALLTVSRLDGAFGLDDLAADADPLSGALAGLAKTARHEWPEVRCRALDAARGSDEALAERVAEELQLSGPLELGLSASGARVPALRSEAAAAGSSPLSAGDVVVVTGGARGVTAAAAVALAETYRVPIALLGRTPEPKPEPEWLKPLKDEGEIKKAILSLANGSHPSSKNSESPLGRPSPREIETAFRLHMANREVLSTLERIRATGVKALYLAADIRDASSVRGALERVARELGPVRALVHGAGVLADRFIEDKQDEHFDPVFDTKVAGLRNLLAALDLPALKAIALFSSVSGRFGRAGQADYAMANEALNKIAQSLSRRLKGGRVVSINWGPWEGGMVTPSLRKVFAVEGVPLLGLRAGGQHLAAELAASGVETVVQGGSTEAALALSTAFERMVDLESHAFLGSHVINGHPVLPAAMMVEWLAHAALHGNPGLSFHGLDDFRVLKGVVLKNGPVSIKAAAGKAERDGDAWRVPVELKGEGGVHARATAVLAARLPAAEAPRAVPALASYPRSPEDAYREVLFHGPLLRGIRQVEGCSEAGIAVRVDPAPVPSAWMRQPLRGAWIAEPLALDAALQAMILWSVARSGAGCLPSGFSSYRQFRAEFPKTGVRAVLRASARGEQLALADVDFLDERGELVARITGSEHTVDPALNAAFRRSVAA